jgi:hypothetical protein
LVFTKENPMRTLWLPLTLLLVSSSWAADKTVLIPLHHVPAGEVERSLTRGALRSGVIGTPIEQDYASLIPPGITAWTVDERRNGIRVTGSEEGIGSLTRIIELIDVPARHVQLSVRVVRLQPGDLNRFEADPPFTPAPGTGPAEYPVVPSREQVADLEAREARAATELTVANNHPLHLAWPGSQNQPSQPAIVMPRVNGDGTVTLYLQRSAVAAAEMPVAGQTIVMRRVAPGQMVVVISPRLGTTLLLKVRDVLAPGGKVGR